MTCHHKIRRKSPLIKIKLLYAPCCFRTVLQLFQISIDYNKSFDILKFKKIKTRGLYIKTKRYCFLPRAPIYTENNNRIPGADPGFRRGGGFVQEFRFENRSYPDVHDFLLRMQVIIAND